MALRRPRPGLILSAALLLASLPSVVVAAPPPTEGPAKAPPPSLDDPPRDAQATLAAASAEESLRALFEMPPSQRDDSYGPRPPGVPSLTREQIVRYGLENPYVSAAEQHVESMRALLRKAKFAWVPQVQTSMVLTPGAAITCDDVSLQGENGPFSYQYCRSTGDPADGSQAVDIQQVQGYFSKISKAGIALRMQAEFVMPITTFGKIVTTQALAKVGVELAALEKLATEQETVLRIYQAHAAVLLARESIAILSEAWKIVQTERTQIEEDLGLGPDGEQAFDADPATLNLDRDPDDLTRLEVGEIELADRMREARLIESRALATLWAIAGNAAPQGFDIEETTLTPDAIVGGLADLDHYVATAQKHRPEARMADAGVKARKVQEKLARTNFLPDLGAVVRLGYGYANKADRDMRTLYYMGRLNFSQIYFGLALSWTLDFHNDAFSLQKARAERREAEYLREAARAMLGLEVEQAYREVLDAEQSMDFAELARDRSWKLVVSEQTSSSIGAGNFEQMRKALTSWAEYEFKYFEAVMERNTAIARLGRATGTSLTEPGAAEVEAEASEPGRP
ncbi:TolC family protein [Nannocystaceae bacterium ST9]